MQYSKDNFDSETGKRTGSTKILEWCNTSNKEGVSTHRVCDPSTPNEVIIGLRNDIYANKQELDGSQTTTLVGYRTITEVLERRALKCHEDYPKPWLLKDAYVKVQTKLTYLSDIL